MLKAIPILAANYKGKIKETLTHIADTEDMKPLCGKVKAEHLSDDSYTWEDPSEATCKTCLSKYKNKKPQAEALSKRILFLKKK